MSISNITGSNAGSGVNSGIGALRIDTGLSASQPAALSGSTAPAPVAAPVVGAAQTTAQAAQHGGQLNRFTITVAAAAGARPLPPTPPTPLPPFTPPVLTRARSDAYLPASGGLAPLGGNPRAGAIFTIPAPKASSSGDTKAD